MMSPILATKLYIPPQRKKVVVRSRLLKRLNEGLHRKLTLISAPAGFGKTTLISEWVTIGDQPSVWLSLDEGDNDPILFLTYFIAALQRMAPHLGENILAALQSAQPPPSEVVLTVLLNEITALAVPFIFVLDDYHRVDAKLVNDALTFLLEHLPAQMRLVITTREDPNLPLARLRARDQMTELRAADLRFTPAEAAEFLSQVMGLDLLPEDVTALENRTEGWIAGLQLAALSMQGRKDIGQFVRAFAGDNRHIVDYLVDEVLSRQPEQVRNFLLQTAILDRLYGPLCDAVTGGEGGAEHLEALERGNFFVISLDDKRNWYRYHHLFADVLHTHLRAEQPDHVATLHGRASVWYEQNGSAADAIHHAFAARDFERAAALIEPVLPVMRRQKQTAVLLGWFHALPEAVFRYRPVLSVVYAHVLLAIGTLEGVEALLGHAERWLTMIGQSVDPAEMIVVDKEAFRHLQGLISIARSGLALAQGDVPGVVTYARQALDLAPEDDHMTRGGAAGFLGLAAWTDGDLEVAHQTFAEGMVSLQKAGFISDVINGAVILASIRITQGLLHEAMRTYERGLQMATKHRPSPLQGAVDMYVGMSELYLERNELQTALQHLLKSQDLGEHMGFPQNRYRWYVAMARMREAQGDFDEALILLDEAALLYMSDFAPHVRPIAALKARIWIAQGRLEDVLDWKQVQRLYSHDELSYVREFEHITLTRMLLALYVSDGLASSLQEAIALLERLLAAAEAGGRMGSVIELLVLQSLAYHMQGDLQAALVALRQALTLAEPERYVRVFLEAGSRMAELLRATANHQIMPNYAGRLLRTFTEVQTVEIHFSTPPVPQPMIDPLSQRELEILRLFNTELSGPEIADELMIALSTIRTHTKRIYSKLNVNNRRAAVNRAAELKLI